jgi:hypothetical protein
MKQNFYKKIVDGSLSEGLEIRSNLEACNPGINLDNKEELDKLGYVKYVYTPEPTDNHNAAKKYVSNDTELEDGSWKNSWSLEDVSLNEQQQQENIVAGFRMLRADRDFFLQRTDHWALQDTSEMTDEMKAYRQALRDLPGNTTDPFNVEWPQDPTDPDGTKY